MSVIATALKHLIAAGVSGDDLVRAVAEMEAAVAPTPPARTARQERNRRYYEGRKSEGGASERLKPSEKRLNASETSEQDASPLPLPSSPQTPQQPTPTPGVRLPARKGLSRVDLARGFLAFWQAYPRKVGKDAAAKAFAKAMGRITEDDPLTVILTGVERALPGWTDPDFTPHPATWLNAGRWDDEPPPIRENRNDRPANDHRSSASYAQPSRAERDQSAALRVLARRGALPGQGEGGGVHDLGPSRPAAA